MASSSSLTSSYSPGTSLIYIFNLIVGTGALTLPHAFQDAGWLLSSLLLSFLCFMSYLTATFIIEALAAANALTQWKKLERLDGLRVANESLLQYYTDNDEISPSQNTESDPLLSRNSSTNSIFLYSIKETFELGQMTSLFFNKTGVTLFYLCITIYLYGDLTIYGAAVATSLADVACYGNLTANYSWSDDCWTSSGIRRMDFYRISLCLFVGILGPFTFFNVTKTKYLQIFTSLLRWLAFACMVILSILQIFRGSKITPIISNIGGIPDLLGVSIYSFMCHHSIPSLITPISNKKNLSVLLGFDYVLILAFYFLLALTGVFAYERIEDLYTLNFLPQEGESMFLNVIHYFLSLFPVFTLSTNFPIIAITLRQNLKTLFLKEGQWHCWIARHLLFPLLTLIPPISVALATNSLQSLVEITGSYAGVGIQYIVPASLVYHARKITRNVIGSNVKNQHSSPFQSNFWIGFVYTWASTCLVFVTYKHIASQN